MRPDTGKPYYPRACCAFEETPKVSATHCYIQGEGAKRTLPHDRFTKIELVLEVNLVSSSAFRRGVFPGGDYREEALKPGGPCFGVASEAAYLTYLFCLHERM